MVKNILLALSALLLPLLNNAAEEPLFTPDFSQAGKYGQWRGWNGDELPVTVAPVTLADGSSLLEFTVDQDNGLNTPIVQLAPGIPVSDNTVLEFEVWGEASEYYELNLFSIEEESEYRFLFPAEANQWTVFRRYPKKADYKRQLGSINLNNGLKGDHLGSVQIAAKGRKVRVRNFRIYNTTTAIQEQPETPRLLDEEYQPVAYRQLERNGVFPYGVITTVAAGNVNNGTMLFDQSGRERFENDLADMKRHYLNAVSNFCDIDEDIDYRLGLMDRYGLYLIETALANSDLTALPADHPYLQWPARYDQAERLICWYGKDEPFDCAKYLANKLLMRRLSPHKPYSSALCFSAVIEALGPYMEITMPDVYNVTAALQPNSPDVTAALMEKNHAMLELSRQQPFNRIWYITQAFSLRRAESQKQLLRYPTPEEIRFDVFQGLAAGVQGIIFFIYNDFVPFLDGEFRNEEFDTTMVDAWGNDNPGYREIARLGQAIVPVMPSLLGAKAEELYQYTPKTRLLQSSFSNEFGRYLIIVNTDLQAAKSFPFAPELPAGEEAFDLLKLEPAPAELTLEAGGGTILMLGTPEHYAQFAAEIRTRQLRTEWEQLQLSVFELNRAGFTVSALEEAQQQLDEQISNGAFAEASAAVTANRALATRIGDSNADYRSMEAVLTEIRQNFGILHTTLTDFATLTRLDGAPSPAWKQEQETIKKLSRDYFRLLREWQHGNFSGLPQAQELTRQVTALLN